VFPDNSDVSDTADSPQHQAKLKTKSYKMTIYWVSFLDGQQRVVLFTCDKTIAEAARLVNDFFLQFKKKEIYFLLENIILQ
jgi:hypothetical protein